VSSPINWAVQPGDTALLQSAAYLKYSGSTYGSITAGDVKTDLKAALASNESAAVVAYLSSICRVLALVA